MLNRRGETLAGSNPVPSAILRGEIMLYRICLSYACFGVIVREGYVTETAPIGKWMLGKHIDKVTDWVLGKGGSITRR